MIRIKTSDEIERMREGGKIAAEILRSLKEFTKHASCTLEIEEHAKSLISKNGVESAFLGKYGYRYNTCLSVNDCIIHGIPNERLFEIGDVIKIDIGIVHKGLIIDHAATEVIGMHNADFDKVKFAKQIRIYEVARKILDDIESTISSDNYSLDISKQIDSKSKLAGYNPNLDYIGHGVGHSLHEKPDIYCFYDERLPNCKLEAGMTLAIEPMISEKLGTTYVGDDGFSVYIVGGGLSAFFEDTVLVTSNGIEVLSK